MHEHILAAMIEDLNYKNSLVRSRETSLMITNLETALNWARQRQINRIKNNTLGTYKK